MSTVRPIRIRNAALASALATMSTLAVAVASPAGAAPSACTSFTGLTETVVTITRHQAAATPGVGDGADFHDELVDSAGKPVGSLDGFLRIIRIDPATGHPLAAYGEKATLANGTALTAGLVDVAVIQAGQIATVKAIGVSGAYRGRTGTRDLRLIDPAKRVYQADITLCR